MKKLFQIALFAAVFLLVSCGGGSKDSDHSCPEGYNWSGTDCVRGDSPIDGGDSGTDTASQPDDGDTADDSDGDDNTDTDTDNPDSGSSDYNGSCEVVRSGGKFEINVETKKLTVGNVTILGSNDLADVYGELWGQNKSTLSEFKIADCFSPSAFKISARRLRSACICFSIA